MINSVSISGVLSYFKWKLYILNSKYNFFFFVLTMSIALIIFFWDDNDFSRYVYCLTHNCGEKKLIPTFPKSICVWVNVMNLIRIQTWLSRLSFWATIPIYHKHIWDKKRKNKKQKKNRFVHYKIMIVICKANFTK